MVILIVAAPRDQHARCVHRALKSLGYHSIWWHAEDFPVQQSHIFRISSSMEYGCVHGNGCFFEYDNPDIVWLRRPLRPTISDVIHAEDKEKVIEENQAFFQSWWYTLSQKAYWVNPIDAVKRARNKSVQLRLAKQVGWKIPDTLFSNDPSMVKQFLLSYRRGDIIYKTLTPCTWHEAGQLRVNYTHEITLDRLPSDGILKSMVGIFQKRIEKSYELRITCMGDHIVAAKILSQSMPDGKTDWRQIAPQHLPIQPCELPRHIQLQCIALMRALGIVFGCMDVIYTPEGEYYFLEVNEQGQFLWIEECCKEIKMLEAFIHFLTQKRHTISLMDVT